MLELILHMNLSLSIIDTIAILFICWKLFRLSKRMINLEKMVDERFIEYLKQLDDKNYRLWKTKLKLEEKLKKQKKSTKL